MHADPLTVAGDWQLLQVMAVQAKHIENCAEHGKQTVPPAGK